MSLHAVGIEEDELPNIEGTRLPSFEGQPVHEVTVKLAAASDMDLGQEKSYKIDQTMRMVVTVRVSRVDHVVDEKSGHLVRQHTLKVVDAIPVEWDSIADAILDR